ncbi:MAG TPA: hypothetical protein VLF93_06505 [Candidatus Saccharimonadales bacterium]|nr:hypothetical protein [Candidatus Saccharimonadales bacterium]
MKWKIYFWVYIVVLILALIDIFTIRLKQLNIFILVYHLWLLVQLVGLFSYTFSKKIIASQFWKYFFWINVPISVIFLIHDFFPHIYPLTYLNVFYTTIPPKTNIFLLFANLIFYVPLLYSQYQLGKGTFQKEKTEHEKIISVSKSKPRFQWGMIQMALWGYSTVLIFFFFIISFLPLTGSKGGHDSDFSVFITIIFAPLVIFWFWILIRFKKYHWNWWRTTLVANALLYSGLIIISPFVPQTDKDSSSGFDFIAVLQLFILLLGLYSFGRDQFQASVSEKENLPT